MASPDEDPRPAPSPPTAAREGGRRRPGWRWAIAALLLAVAAAGVALAFGWYVRSLRVGATVEGLRAGGIDVGGLPLEQLAARVDDIADRFLGGAILIDLQGETLRARRRDLGVLVDRKALVDDVRLAGRCGNLIRDLRDRRRARQGRMDVGLPLSLDRARALDALGELKDHVDRLPVDARLDLDHHGVLPEREGRVVDVYLTLARLEKAVQEGAEKVEAAMRVVRPAVRRDDLSSIDISTVVGAWETRYSMSQVDSDRTYNLKVGADRMNGLVLRPREVFSFNEAVGRRTEKEGYRVAPVIQSGELVDGLAGGMCQIASTLHAAAFFAGIEIVSSTPHSRPSAYIPMGLDSTVVYPSVDLKLRNPYDFPITIHYRVSQGVVRVELLGKERPRKVVFEREILQETDFKVDRRADPEAPKGQRLVLQDGYPGYRLVRRRYTFDAQAALPRRLADPTTSLDDLLRKARVVPLRVESWTMHYPATTLIEAVGSGPKRLRKKDKPPSHRIPPLPRDQKPFGRIAR